MAAARVFASSAHNICFPSQSISFSLKINDAREASRPPCLPLLCVRVHARHLDKRLSSPSLSHSKMDNWLARKRIAASVARPSNFGLIRRPGHWDDNGDSAGESIDWLNNLYTHTHSLPPHGVRWSLAIAPACAALVFPLSIHTLSLPLFSQSGSASSLHLQFHKDRQREREREREREYGGGRDMAKVLIGHTGTSASARRVYIYVYIRVPGFYPSRPSSLLLDPARASRAFQGLLKRQRKSERLC